MDNLTRNAIAAKQAGMSYGRWKAMQEPVTQMSKRKTDDVLRCKNCGKEIDQATNKSRKYCDYTCSQEYYRKQNRKGGKKCG